MLSVALMLLDPLNGTDAAADYALVRAGLPSSITLYKYTVSLGTVIASVDAFLAATSGTDRVIVSETSIILQLIDAYVNVSPYTLGVLCFSLDATSNSLSSTLTSYAITYGPFNQYMVLSLFLILRAYQSASVVLLYDDDDPLYGPFIADMSSQVELQASLLFVPYTSYPLSDPALVIPPNSLVFILASGARLQDVYVDPLFLSRFPSSSYIMMSDISSKCRDIFRTIPAFVAEIFPADFTTTSEDVYERCRSVSDNPSVNIYPMFDIVYSLAKWSTTAITSFTMNSYLSYNAFSDIPPSYAYSNNFDLTKNGPFYGSYMCVFTKNVFFASTSALYLKNFRGGVPFLPDSQSIFLNVGKVPFFSSEIFFCLNEPFTLRDPCGNVKAVRNAKDVIQLNGAYRLSQIELLSLNFVYRYTDDGFFSYLGCAFVCCRALSVNPTMSLSMQYATLPSITG